GSVGEEPNINQDNTLPVLYLPTSETVQLNLRSLDVNHSFYVPAFLFKRDLIQGVHNTVDVNVTKTGEYIGECTQLCGTYHSYMRFLVDVMPLAQFNTWLSQQTPDSCYYAGSGPCPSALTSSAP
ncbi:MAG: cytochrome c oxidase subunit II, partial [Acidimicrobiales bacterium]